MSSAWAQLVGVLTLMSMLTFLAIWLWVWLPHHKRDFDTLARMPMDEAGDRTTAEDETP